MLFYSEESEWGEVLYYPTTLGKVLLGVAIAALLVVAILLAKSAAKKFVKRENIATDKKPGFSLSVKQLAVCAVAIALGTVLSDVKLFHFPTGGSITAFSMLIICLPGYFFGLGAGLMTGVAYGVLQLIIDPYVLYPLQLVVDYLLAFGALGLSGLLNKGKFGVIWGYILAVIGRYVFAVISGWIFFGEWAWEGWNPLAYSLAYNAIYIFAEAAATIVILLIPMVRKVMIRLKRELNT